MKTRIESDGDFKNIIKILESFDNSTGEVAMTRLGREAKGILEKNSPVDTGEFRSGWAYELNSNKKGVVVDIVNNSHPEVDGLASMLEYGHGTRNGGYVQGTHFIRDSMNEIDNLVHDVGGELLNG